MHTDINFTQGYEAGIKALLDAHITYDDVETGVACYCYGDSTCGQRVFYQFGLTGIPIYNVNNNCSTGSTAPTSIRTSLSPLSHPSASAVATPLHPHAYLSFGAGLGQRALDAFCRDNPLAGKTPSGGYILSS